MNKTIWALMAALALLSACSSTPQPVVSYLLPPVPTTMVDYQSSMPVVTLAPVSLDNLLQSRGIVYQTSPTEAVVARQHLWAESLQVQLTHRLLAGLRQQQGSYWIIRSNPQILRPEAAKKLLVSFDQFNGSYQGKALVAGEWAVLNSQDELLESQSFSYQQLLEAEGYTALVEALSTATDYLVSDLCKAL